MMKTHLLWLRLLPTLLSCLPMTAKRQTVPETLTRERLRDGQFKKRWYTEEGVVMLAPKFGPTVKALNHKPISITGYIIPIDLESGQYVVSKMPVTSCFSAEGPGRSRSCNDGSKTPTPVSQ